MATTNTITRYSPSQKSIDLYNLRYLDKSKSETIDDLWTRVAGGNNDYKRLMEEGLFLPNSPALFNLGTGNGCTSSACFVFDVGDYMLYHDGKVREDSIVRTREKAILVAKAGGGVGYYLGDLRPAKSLIKTVHRVACGPVGVLFDYHPVHRLVTQGGKRDLAQMAVLPVVHPDIRTFIHCKDTNPQDLSSFNISVSWDTASITAALNAEKENDYRKLWDEQVTSAWGHGCPGMFFVDTVNRSNPNPHLGLMRAPNPCVTGDTVILCRQGWLKIEDVAGREVEVWNGQEWSRVTPRVTGHDRPILRVTLNDGHHLDCTPEHGFYLADGTKLTAAALVPGDSLEKYGEGDVCRPDEEVVTDWNGYLAGFYEADGFHGTERDDQRITFYGEEKVAIGRTLANLNLVRLQPYDEKHDRQRAVLNVRVPAKGTVPMHAEHSYRLSWLAGLLDGDGCRVYSDKARRSYSYQISSTNKEFLRQVSLMLRTLGVPSRVSKSHDAGRTINITGTEYECQECFVLCIGSMGARRLGRMGMPCMRVQTDDNNPQRGALQFVKVVSVVPMGTAKTVYCFTEPKRGRGVFNGILTSNCGETPNRSDEPCSLGSLCLWRFVNLKTRQIDWGILEDRTRIAFRFMDDILDRNEFPHPDITRAANLTRKLGLGVMGWADTLALLGIHYDTQEAVDLADRVMLFIKNVCREESVKLARDKGPYPGFSFDKTQADMMRNETGTSIAPTGSIANLIDASYSIEPHMPGKRVTNEGMQMVDGIPVYHLLDGFSPKFAHEIHWSWHVKHQAAFQRHTDLGVSKTINMDESVTKQDVSDAYRMMYELGCKGGTIYRNNCRPEQVVITEKRKSVYTTALREGVSLNGHSSHPARLTEAQAEEFRKAVEEYAAQAKIMDPPGMTVIAAPSSSPQRRELGDGEVPTIRRKFQIGDTKGYLHVGLFPDGTPGEIFLRVSLQGSTVEGMLNAWAISFSHGLQSGMALAEIIRAHEGARFEPLGMTGVKEVPVCTSIPDFVCRWLRWRFLTPTTVVAVSGEEDRAAQYGKGSGQLCPQCGGELKYHGGCLTCVKDGCHWTRCG